MRADVAASGAKATRPSPPRATSGGRETVEQHVDEGLAAWHRPIVLMAAGGGKAMAKAAVAAFAKPATFVTSAATAAQALAVPSRLPEVMARLQY